MISKEKKFIYVHIYKTGGTSIRRALNPYTSKGDQLMDMARKKLWKLPLISNKSNKEDHLTASEFIRRMGQTNFESFFSFAFVRNPWDWQVSLYSFMLKEKRHFQHEFVKKFSGFNEYIRWRCQNEIRLQKDFVFSGNGNQLVNFIGRFENLEDDFKNICSLLKIDSSLSKLNVSGHRPYQEFYNPETIELVRKAFEPDIKCFDYDFSPSKLRKPVMYLPKNGAANLSM